MDLWLRRYHQRPDAGHVVVCFPHAGGSANHYRPLSEALPESVELFAVQYPGRQDRLREPVIGDVVAVAELVAPLVAGLDGRPLALFGHSMGASVAFEVARRLERDGKAPVALFVSARRPPSRAAARRNHLLSDPDLVTAVKALGGPGSLLLDDPEFAALALPAIRGDFRAAETYRREHDASVNCPVLALVGDSDTEADATLASGWRDHTTATFTLHEFPGGHFYLDHHLPTIATLLTTHLTTPHP